MLRGVAGILFDLLLGVAAGIVTLKWPVMTSLARLFVITYWSIFRGILEIVAAARPRDLIHGEWWLILGGIASIAFGALLIMNPGPGLLAVIWLVGLYAVIFGISLVMLSLRLKNLAGKLAAPTPVRAR